MSREAYLFWQTDQPPGCSCTMKLILYLIPWLIRCETLFLSRQEIQTSFPPKWRLESQPALSGWADWATVRKEDFCPRAKKKGKHRRQHYLTASRVTNKSSGGRAWRSVWGQTHALSHQRKLVVKLASRHSGGQSVFYEKYDRNILDPKSSIFAFEPLRTIMPPEESPAPDPMWWDTVKTQTWG